MVVETGVNDEDGLEHCSQHYSQRMLIAFYCSSRMHVLQFQYCCDFGPCSAFSAER